MKKFLIALFAFSISTSPVAAWGWGEGKGDCPYSKDKANHEKTEQVEETEK